uniref:Uncharacterized protein n=1 Tax=Aegilops tauschii subsp. strangulata TaxID=200361 RepID=A0A453RG49_AEGTS
DDVPAGVVGKEERPLAEGQQEEEEQEEGGATVFRGTNYSLPRTIAALALWLGGIHFNVLLILASLFLFPLRLAALVVALQLVFMFIPLNDEDKLGRKIGRSISLNRLPSIILQIVTICSVLFVLGCSTDGSAMLAVAGSYASTPWATSRSACMWRTTTPSIPAGLTCLAMNHILCCRSAWRLWRIMSGLCLCLSSKSLRAVRCSTPHS